MRRSGVKRLSFSSLTIPVVALALGVNVTLAARTATTITHGPTMPPGPGEPLRLTHGPTMPPGPGEPLRLTHGPTMPPGPGEPLAADRRPHHASWPRGTACG